MPNPPLDCSISAPDRDDCQSGTSGIGGQQSNKTIFSSPLPSKFPLFDSGLTGRQRLVRGQVHPVGASLWNGGETGGDAAPTGRGAAAVVPAPPPRRNHHCECKNKKVWKLLPMQQMFFHYVPGYPSLVWCADGAPPAAAAAAATAAATSESLLLRPPSDTARCRW